MKNYHKQARKVTCSTSERMRHASSYCASASPASAAVSNKFAPLHYHLMVRKRSIKVLSILEKENRELHENLQESTLAKMAHQIMKCEEDINKQQDYTFLSKLLGCCSRGEGEPAIKWLPYYPYQSLKPAQNSP